MGVSPRTRELRPLMAVPDLLAFANALVVLLKDGQEPLWLHFDRARDGMAELNHSPSKYLGDLVAHISAPRLYNLCITFFEEIIFYTPHFIQFVSHMSMNALNEAQLTFSYDIAMVWLSSQTSNSGLFKVTVSCRGLNGQVSGL